MDDIFCGTIKTPSNAEVGENAGFDRDSLKAYVYESKLKRVIGNSRKDVLDYLEEKFKITSPIRVRIDSSSQTPEKNLYEDFDVIETIKSKITSFSSKRCLQLWDIYEEKGIKSMLNAIQYLSPIQKI